MVLPDPGARGARRDRRAHRTCRSPSIELLDQLARAVFRGVPEVQPDTFVGGFGARDRSRSRSRCVGIFARVPALPQGPRARRPSTRSTAKLGPRRARARQRLLLRRRHLAARRRPEPRGSPSWLDRRGRPQDHRRRGQRRRLRWFGAPARGVQQLQDGLVRRYALGITLGAVGAAPLRRDLGGAVAVATSRSSRVIIVTPFVGALICLLLMPARRPELAKAVGYAAIGGHARASRSAALEVQTRTSAASSSSRTSAGSPRSASRYIVGVDGISLFMVVDHRGAVPDRPARVGEVHRAPRQGVHRVVPAARGRDHGHLPLARPHRCSSCSGRRCSSRCTSSSRDGGANGASTRR